ncbi:hypothetical protein CH330_02075 [candidate division WOR-3 bacterium JGI_Cruoil_03_51_56]|uniref:Uncharacterized protein n=1 Tax=candidate division WOR-3 bacterium JGI_Cruoil_03_51_56 TaxID=1973747 RepID=A0A235BWT6_UNCW3|nr:MAG: hypothetical protein CH330_02075 [candidate division WOR-3 bacterium JGI_Cruoil_03_51_56]
MQNEQKISTVHWLGGERFLSGLKRVNCFCGGYGSGKTEVAINFAIHLAVAGNHVRVADLDVVNAYFRSREVRTELQEYGIDVLIPGENLINTDLPIIQPEIKGAVEHPDGLVVLDLGGDPAGARATASFAEAIPADDYSGFFVLNSRRPFADTPKQVEKLMAEIGRAAGLDVTGIVVNSHLINETAPDTIEEGIRLAETVSRETDVGIAFVVVERRLLKEFDAVGCRYPVMVLDRHLLKPWESADKLGKDKFKL